MTHHRYDDPRLTVRADHTYRSYADRVAALGSHGEPDIHPAIRRVAASKSTAAPANYSRRRASSAPTSASTGTPCAWPQRSSRTLGWG